MDEKLFEFFKTNHFQAVFEPLKDLEVLQDATENNREREYKLLKEAFSNNIEKYLLKQDYAKLIHNCLVDKHSRSHTCLQELQFVFQIIEAICYNLFKTPWREEFKVIRTYSGQMQFLYAFLGRDMVNNKILKSLGFEEDTQLDEMRMRDSVDRKSVLHLAYDTYLMYYYYQSIELIRQDTRCRCSPVDLVEILNTNKNVSPLNREEVLLKLQPPSRKTSAVDRQNSSNNRGGTATDGRLAPGVARQVSEDNRRGASASNNNQTNSDRPSSSKNQAPIAADKEAGGYVVRQPSDDSRRGGVASNFDVSSPHSLPPPGKDSAFIQRQCGRCVFLNDPDRIRCAMCMIIM